MKTVTLNGMKRQYPAGTSYEAILADFGAHFPGIFPGVPALVIVDGRIRELFKRLDHDCTLQVITLGDAIGHKTYVRTATMLFLKAVYDEFGPEAAQNCRVEFAVANGKFICPWGRLDTSPRTAERIRHRMEELVAARVPFMKKSFHMDAAMELFRARGMRDKEKLFRYRRSSFVNLYEADGFYDYYYGYMLPNAGYIRWFDVISYDEGFMLILPTQNHPEVLEPFQEQKKLFTTLKNSSLWGRSVGLETVGDMNDRICRGGLSDLILVQEAEQERRIGEIAKDIVSRGGVKFVMIAGPSSSGKTSFSHRLSIQLRTLGLVPHTIALDDYFKDRENTPRDENGNYNFECLEAIDVRQFNEDMTRLLAGERVELPTFNFKIGRREYRGNVRKLEPEDILVIEGIHGLNEKMSTSLPDESKYKIYISALTNINVDEHNRIPTTDGRLLRRMVRDARTRGTDARSTLAMWYSVRKGEEENIFPYQEQADAMFNSVLIYELAALKLYAEPLLFNIPKDVPEYYEANRLLKFLDYFLGISCEDIPNNSICREFVGGSCFRV